MPNIRNKVTQLTYEVTEDDQSAIQESDIAGLFDYNVSDIPQHVKQNSAGMTYNSFIAIIDNLSDTTSGNPNTIVLENTFGNNGGIVSVVRSGTGAFTLSSNGQWTDDNTHVMVTADDRSNGGDSDTPSAYKVIKEVNYSGNENQIFFKVVDGSGDPVNAFGKLFVDVKVKI